MFNKIYLIRKRALGDVLWVEPLFREICKKGKEVVFYTKNPELFENHPCQNLKVRSKLSLIEKIYCTLFDFLGFKGLVINLDMSYENNPKSHILSAYCQRAGIAAIEQYPRLYLSQKELAMYPEVKSKSVVLHLESFTDKNYRKVYGIDWATITQKLKADGYQVYLIGKNPITIEGAQFIQTTIREMIALINKCSIFIGIDSGPSHLAASLNKPSILFFGAVNPKYRHFDALFNGIIMQGKCEFQNCYHDTISITGPVCKVVGAMGIPPCSNHDTNTLIKNIDKLVTEKVAI